LKGGGVLLTALYVILGILLLIALVLCLRVNLHIKYKSELAIYLRILFVKIPLIPQRKSKKIKQKKKSQSADSPKVVTSEERQKKSPTLLENLGMIKEVLAVFLKAFAKKLKVKLARIHVKVATDDAAQTAILYGAVSGSIALIVELIDSYTNLSRLGKRSIIVESDFLSDRSEADISISLSISVFDAISVLLKSAFRYFKLKNKNAK
jgi:hypothetical protein